jgi:hypothetical protein
MSKYSVADNANNEWHGVITRTEEGKWKSESGGILDTQSEASDHNDPGSPPVRPA